MCSSTAMSRNFFKAEEEGQSHQSKSKLDLFPILFLEREGRNAIQVRGNCKWQLNIDSETHERR